MVLLPFSVIVILPLLFYLVDGYYEKNMKKGIYTILAFLLVMLSAVFLIKLFGIRFALTAPVLVILLLLIGYLIKKKI